MLQSGGLDTAPLSGGLGGASWLVMSESDGEASKTVSELESYPGTDAVVEARVESSRMTKNGAEQNASNDSANGVEVSKLTSVFSD